MLRLYTKELYTLNYLLKQSIFVRNRYSKNMPKEKKGDKDQMLLCYMNFFSSESWSEWNIDKVSDLL